MGNIKKNISEIGIDTDTDRVNQKASFKFQNEELVEDLKNSLQLAIKDASDTFTKLEDDINLKVDNEEIRKETKEIMSHLQIEFEKSINILNNKILNSYNKNSIFKEEE
tara:strand:- start:543 stop:869 length:327 start_codon:yes stop_codon:yes gene_type:complete